MMRQITNRFLSALLALLLCAMPLAAMATAVAFAAPTAVSFATAVPVTAQSVIQLQGADSDGTPLTFATLSDPAHGTLSNLNPATGAVIYTPAAGYTGSDSFTYKVTSGGEDSATATVTITVTAAKTRVVDSFTNPDGTPRRGKVSFFLSEVVTSPAGLIPAKSSVTCQLTAAGQCDVSLYPSRAINPVRFYQVWYYDPAGSSQFLGVYDIPASTTSITLAGRRVTDANLSAQFVFASKAEVNALTAAVAAATAAQLYPFLTSGRYVLWNGVTFADSIVSESGGVVTVAGDMNVTGTLTTPALSALIAKVGGGGSTPPCGGTALISPSPGVSIWQVIPGGGGGSASFEEQEHYRLLNTTLEPAAIEPIKRGAYTYTVGPNETKVALSVWHSALGAANGRFEIRSPAMWMPLHNTTLYGIYSVGGQPLAGSHAVIADPTKGVYTDPKALYYARQYQLASVLKPTNVGIMYAGTDVSFSTDTPALCGTYGCVLTQTTRFDAPYVVIVTGSGQWLNMDNEEGDLPQGGARVNRTGNRLTMPLNGYMLAAARIGPGAAENADFPPKGSITYTNVDSTWSKVPDTRVWLLRDDSWGVGTGNLNVDLTKWTISDPTPSSTTTGVTIHQGFKWHEQAAASTGVYGTVAMLSTQTFTRAAGLTAEVDFYAPGDAQCALGWANTTSAAITNWAHAVVFETQTGAKRYSIWEDNTFRIQSGDGSIIPFRPYHVRITTNADGSATYKLQGQGWTDAGGNLAEPGSAIWATLTVPGSASAKNSLKLMATCATGTAYFRDLKVSAAPQ